MYIIHVGHVDGRSIKGAGVFVLVVCCNGWS